MIASLIGLVSLGGLLATAKWYVDWLQATDSKADIQVRLEQELVGKEFHQGTDTFFIKQLNYIDEYHSILYKFRKYIPLVRAVKGQTVLEIQSKNWESREYIWDTEDEYGIDFATYLRDVRQDDYPRVAVENVESLMNELGFLVTRVRLKIDSVDSSQLIKTIEKVPSFHEYYFENFPGDSRYRSKRGTDVSNK